MSHLQQVLSWHGNHDAVSQVLHASSFVRRQLNVSENIQFFGDDHIRVEVDAAIFWRKKTIYRFQPTYLFGDLLFPIKQH